MKKYTALIIDLKKSRAYSIKYRNSIQEYIMDIIHSLNNIFYKSLVKNVDFSAGDEIQGLFDSAEAAYLYFRMFSMLVSPIEVRAGIGVGNWDVVVEGAFTEEKENVFSSVAARSITEGKSMLVVTDDMEMSRYAIPCRAW